MTRRQKAKLAHYAMLTIIVIVAIVYIYPVYLMFINSVKPFGEVVSDVIAWPTRFEFENYSHVIGEMDYVRLFFNNVIITVVGIAGIIVISAAAAYIIDRRANRFTAIARTFIITPMLIPFQTRCSKPWTSFTCQARSSDYPCSTGALA